MIAVLVAVWPAAVPPAALALSSEAKEFMTLAKALEPLHCEKRRLRRQIILAQAEQRDADAAALQKKFAALDRDPKTSKLERRLAQLEPRVSKSADPEDLTAISRQQREAFYRCD